MEDKKPKFGKYLAVYMARLKEAEYGMAPGQSTKKIDILWPVKLLWLIPASLWKWLFNKQTKK